MYIDANKSFLHVFNTNNVMVRDNIILGGLAIGGKSLLID